MVGSNDFDRVNAVYEEFNKLVKNATQHSEWYFEIAKDISKDPPAQYSFSESEQELIFFSDCVVWSYPMKKLVDVSLAYTLSFLCQSLSVLQYSLFNKKIVIRGGVCVGDLYIDNNKVFGPGLVEAYELEKKAKYPRIAFDQKMIEGISKSEMSWLSRYISYDYCGFYYLDIFKRLNSTNKSLKAATDPIQKIALEKAMKMYLNVIMPVISEGIKNEDSNVKIKYEWLRTKLFEIEDLVYLS